MVLLLELSAHFQKFEFLENEGNLEKLTKICEKYEVRDASIEELSAQFGSLEHEIKQNCFKFIYKIYFLNFGSSIATTSQLQIPDVCQFRRIFSPPPYPSP